MPFVEKKNLILYVWIFLFLSIAISQTYAHGIGGDDEGEEGGGGEENSSKTPSVFASDYEHDHGTVASGNIGLGFGLTVMAAIASALGSLTPFLDTLFPFIPFLAHIKITESKGFLAGSLSFSAGVLLFLTLGDLFPEAVSSFDESKLFDKKYSSLVASSVFIFTIFLIILSKWLIKTYRKNGRHVMNSEDETLDHGSSTERTLHDVKIDSKNSTKSDEELVTSRDAKKFKILGIQVAVALALHNFPEGLASFATTIKDERIGIIFAIALSLHKIPEGLIISLPIYYATGSRWIAFAIAATVGVISQMLGAVLGYALFVTVWNDSVSGFLFAMVTASLLYAILHGMLPMAHHYDPEDKYVTNYTFAGLIFFAIVASIFALA